MNRRARRQPSPKGDCEDSAEMVDLECNNFSLVDMDTSATKTASVTKDCDVPDKIEKEVELQKQFRTPKPKLQPKSIAALRLSVMAVWLIAAIIVSWCVSRYTRNSQFQEFEWHYQFHADKLLTSFEAAVDQKLDALETMATALTTFARYSNSSFPFVTLPEFEVAGSNARILADALTIHWLPLVSNEQREEWEQYSMAHRFHIDQAYEQDEYLRQLQDVELGYVDPEGRYLLEPMQSRPQEEQQHRRELPADSNQTIDGIEVIDNMLQDGTRYHPRLFNFEANKICPDGSGPFLPSWQRTPVNAERQHTLNVDFAVSQGLSGVLPYLLQNSNNKGVLLNHVFIHENTQGEVDPNILVSQYRHNIEAFANDPETKLAYPVYDGLDHRGDLVGVLSSTLYWRLYLIDVLPQDAKGLICVIENTFGQSFFYRVDGPEVTSLGEDPYNNPDLSLPELYSDMEFSHQVRHITRPLAETLSYTALPLDTDYSIYTLKIYPSSDTAEVYQSGEASFVYTGLVAGVFAVTAFVFLVYDFEVRKRQRNTSLEALEQAHRAATAERELNEYIAHEVRNPLSAALSACSFVRSALLDHEPSLKSSSRILQQKQRKFWEDEESRKTVREDVDIIQSSLRFINELLRSMLDLHRAADRHLTVTNKPTDIALDVLQPVASMMYQRDDNFKLIWECEDDLIVETDPLRLKQVLFNLGRNATKFVEKGYVKLSAKTEKEPKGTKTVRLFVEDTGPGIPAAKRKNLFAKFQESLDLLSQGTGIGLCLCHQLMDLMGGEVWLDEDFDSGVPGSPGSRFVIDLKREPLDDNGFARAASLSLLTEAAKGNSGHFVHSLSNGLELISSQGNSAKALKSPRGSKRQLETTKPPGSTHFVSKEDPPDMVHEDEPRSSTKALPDELSVLFVDDDTILRKLFNRTIKRVAPGWKVQEAANGETAIRLTETEHFDLIFMDQYMASTEKQLLGTEATRELRAKGVTARICGLSANDVQQHFMGAGADGFMFKPITCEREELKQELLGILYG